MITKLNQLEFNQITGGNNTLSGILAVGAAALFMTARGNNLISNPNNMSILIQKYLVSKIPPIECNNKERKANNLYLITCSSCVKDHIIWINLIIIALIFL